MLAAQHRGQSASLLLRRTCRAVKLRMIVDSFFAATSDSRGSIRCCSVHAKAPTAITSRSR